MPRMAEETGYVPLPSSDQSQLPTLCEFEGFDPASAFAPQQQKDWLRVDAHGTLSHAKASRLIDTHLVAGLHDDDDFAKA